MVAPIHPWNCAGRFIGRFTPRDERSTKQCRVSSGRKGDVNGVGDSRRQFAEILNSLNSLLPTELLYPTGYIWVRLWPAQDASRGSSGKAYVSLHSEHVHCSDFKLSVSGRVCANAIHTVRRDATRRSCRVETGVVNWTYAITQTACPNHVCTWNCLLTYVTEICNADNKANQQCYDAVVVSVKNVKSGKKKRPFATLSKRVQKTPPTNMQFIGSCQKSVISRHALQVYVLCSMVVTNISRVSQTRIKARTYNWPCAKRLTLKNQPSVAKGNAASNSRWVI